MILTILKNYGAPFPAEVGDDSIRICCAWMLAMVEAVIVMDSCSGDTRARSGLGQDAVSAMNSFNTGYVG